MEVPLTVEEFSTLMQGEEKTNLQNILATIAVEATPNDVRMARSNSEPTNTDWVGWR